MKANLVVDIPGISDFEDLYCRICPLCIKFGYDANYYDSICGYKGKRFLSKIRNDRPISCPLKPILEAGDKND